MQPHDQVQDPQMKHALTVEEQDIIHIQHLHLETMN